MKKEKMSNDIPIWEKEYGGERFLEYFTCGISGALYHDLFHPEEVVPHIPLVKIEIGRN